MYILDTNTLSESRRPGLNPRVAEWLDRHDEGDYYISVMSFGELARGIERLHSANQRQVLELWVAGLRQRFIDRILLVDIEVAITWGRLGLRNELRGRTPPLADLMIAATAARHGMSVVTRNVKDFEPFGVPIINPWDDENGA